ncbi:hypothetical protein D3C81_2160060 [compost metagenome]
MCFVIGAVNYIRLRNCVLHRDVNRVKWCGICCMPSNQLIGLYRKTDSCGRLEGCLSGGFL